MFIPPDAQKNNPKLNLLHLGVITAKHSTSKLIHGKTVQKSNKLHNLSKLLEINFACL